MVVVAPAAASANTVSIPIVKLEGYDGNKHVTQNYCEEPYGKRANVIPRKWTTKSKITHTVKEGGCNYLKVVLNGGLSH